MSALDWLFAALLLYIAAALLCLLMGWRNRSLDGADQEGGR